MTISGSKKRLKYLVSTRITFKYNNTYRLKISGWRKIYSANIDQMKNEMGILISDGADCRTEKIIRNIKGYS